MGWPITCGRRWARPNTLTFTNALTAKRLRGVRVGSSSGGSAPSIGLSTLIGTVACLILAGTGSGAVSLVRRDLKHVKSGVSAQTPTSAFDYTWGPMWDEIDLAANWAAAANGNIGMWSVADASDNELARVSNINGKIRTTIITGNTQATTTATVMPQNTTKRLTIAYKPAQSGVPGSGYIQVWLDGVELTECFQTHSISTSVSQLVLSNVSYSAGGHANRVEVFSSDNVDDYTRSLFGLTPGSMIMGDRLLGVIKGCWNGEVSIMVGFNPGAKDAAWISATDLKARLFYHEGTVWNAGSAITGPEVSIVTADDFINHINVTGLAAGNYVGKIRCYRAVDANTYYESPHTLSWKMHDLTTPNDFLIGITHCRDHETGQPWRFCEVHRQLGVDWVVNTDDIRYNDGGGGGVRVSDTIPANGYTESLRDGALVFEDRFFAALHRTCPIEILPGDHCWFENGANMGKARKTDTDATFMGVGINPTGANGTGRATLCDDSLLAGASVSKGTLYDNNRLAFNTLWGLGTIQRAHASNTEFGLEMFRKRESAKTLFAYMDTRTFQDNAGTEPTSGGAATCTGNAQRLYWLNQFATTTKPIVVIFSGVAWTHRVGGNDNYVDIAPNEMTAFLDALQSNGNVKCVVVINGDRHYTLIDRPNLPTAGGASYPKLKACVLIGPAVKGLMPAFSEAWATEGDVLYATDGGYDDDNTAVFRAVGTLRINEKKMNITLATYEGDGYAKAFEKTIWQQPATKPRTRRMRARGG